MKSKAIPILLVLIMLAVATGVSAEGQAKVDVCHLDEYGNYLLISIADPAVQAHLAHGDVRAGTNGFDTSCQPVQQYPAGCFQFTGVFDGNLYVKLVGGTAVEDIAGYTSYLASDCEEYSPWTFNGPVYAIRAADFAAADSLCQAINQGVGWEVVTIETPTPGLYRCGPVE